MRFLYEKVTTSRIIAEYFGKAHRNVSQTIENLDCGEEFNLLNFKPIIFWMIE